MTIRVKLSLILTVTIAGSVAAATLGFLSLQRRALARAQAEKEQLLLDGVRKTAAESLLAKDPLMLLSYLTQLRAERPEVLTARVLLDGAWQTVGAPGPADASGTTRLVEAALPGAPERTAAVELQLSARLLAERERREFDAAAAAAARAAAGAILLGALLSYPLSLTLTRRIVAIERALAEIGAGRYVEVGATDGSDELAALARNVDEMSRRLKELEEMKKLIVASVSHELRSPLGAIESKVRDMLSEPAGVPESARAGLQSIRDSAARLEHFVSSMLEVARIERGRLIYTPRVGELAPIIVDAAAFFAEKARDAGLTLTAAPAAGIPPFSFDPDLVAQVLANLVSNALKFTPKGGRVHVTAAVAGREALVRVEDTGVGVPEEARGRIFTPFERVPNSLRATGTGLGLSISKSIVERHGGRIGVEPREGGGSVFYFALPLERKQ